MILSRLQEATAVLRRNRSAAIVLGALLFVVAGMAFLLGVSVGSGETTAATTEAVAATVEPPSTTSAARTSMVLFIHNDATEAEARALGEALAEFQGVTGWVYVSQEEAVLEAFEMFANDDRQTEIIKADPTIIPASVRVATVDRTSAIALEELVDSLPESTIVIETTVGWGEPKE